MRAIQSVALGKAEIVDIPEPELKPDSILVRPHYVANNPCDFIISDIEPLFNKDQVVGCDFAGVVVKIGSSVQTSLNPGDRVFGVVAGGTGCDVTKGAFAELIPSYGDFCFPIPKSLGEPEAATLGVGISTMAVSFYMDFGIPLPDDDPAFGNGKPFFVYAGSTSSGLLAIQFAKLSGFKVITTCSPQNFDLVKEVGADEAYDYHEFDQCVNSIKKSVGDDLQYAYVCVRADLPAKMCAETLSTKGSKYVTIAGNACPRYDIQSGFTYGQSVMAESYKTQTGIVERTPEVRALGLKVWRMALRKVEDGKIRPPPYELREGLEGALKGIDDLRNNLVSGKKLVSRMSS